MFYLVAGSSPGKARFLQKNLFATDLCVVFVVSVSSRGAAYFIVFVPRTQQSLCHIQNNYINQLVINNRPRAVARLARFCFCATRPRYLRCGMADADCYLRAIWRAGSMVGCEACQVRGGRALRVTGAMFNGAQPRAGFWR